jgi:hypothetical protein
LDVCICWIVVCAGRARASMQRLVKCCLRAALASAVLELPAKDSRAPRAACGYGALVRRFTARRYSATAGDALSKLSNYSTSRQRMASCALCTMRPARVDIIIALTIVRDSLIAHMVLLTKAAINYIY